MSGATLDYLKWLEGTMAMRWHLFALGLTAVIPMAANVAAQEVALPGGRTECFELVAARAGTIPGAPMLINKCAGTTYVLTRQGKSGESSRAAPDPSYAWVPIAIIEKPVKAESAPVLKSKREEAKAASGKKCFTYDNRTFCE